MRKLLSHPFHGPDMEHASYDRERSECPKNDLVSAFESQFLRLLKPILRDTDQGICSFSAASLVNTYQMASAPLQACLTCTISTPR